MKSIVWVVCVCLINLFASGCGSKQSEAERKAAEEAARAQQLIELLDSEKKAMEEKRFDVAVKDLESAVNLKDDPEVRALLQQAQKARDAAHKAAYDQSMIIGNEALKAKDYSAAVKAFKDALVQMPDDKVAAVSLNEAEYHDFLFVRGDPIRAALG